MSDDEKKQLPQGSWIGVGIAIGVALGAALENIAIGIALGVAFGVALEGSQSVKKTSASSSSAVRAGWIMVALGVLALLMIAGLLFFVRG